MAILIDRFQVFPPNPIEAFYYEVYEVNEQSIKGELIRFVSGIDYTQPWKLADLQAEIENNQSTPFEPKPDWGLFIRDCYSNSGTMDFTTGYPRIRIDTQNQDAKLLVENICVSLGISHADLAPEDYPILQFNWQQIITGLPENRKPTAEEVANLRAIASASKMKFTFDENCLITIQSYEN